MNIIKPKNDFINLKLFWVMFSSLAIFLILMAFYPIRTLINWDWNIRFYLVLSFGICYTGYKLIQRFGKKSFIHLALLAFCFSLTLVQLNWIMNRPLGIPLYSDPPCPDQTRVNNVYATWDTGFSCLFNVGSAQYLIVERYIGWRFLAIRTGEFAKHHG